MASATDTIAAHESFRFHLRGIDIFVKYPVDFDGLWGQGTQVELSGASPRIASIDHLILMKRAAGRPQDLLDIHKLETLRQYLAEDDDTRK